ncbi:MAG: SURF1 family protein, partial [Gammaproteobacteria bacterium]|nr:SURF1 family protein [Gammaproteobacteria bacterium]
MPHLVAVVFVGLFCNLGNWQLDRAAEKAARVARFGVSIDPVKLKGVGDPRPVQELEFVHVMLEGR